MQKSFLFMALVFASFVSAGQASGIERLFITRANEVRDSLGLAPLILIEQYRQISLQHAGYVHRTGQWSHSQDKSGGRARFYPDPNDRVRAFGPSGVFGQCEILTGGYSAGPFYRGMADSTMAAQCVTNFMNSPPHRMALLSPSSSTCTVGIIRSNERYVCVVNFLQGF